MNHLNGALSREILATNMTQPRKKVLVVQADYWALTDRIDPNVIFWNPGFARNGVPSIPEGITDVWLSKHLSMQHEVALSEQAKSRGVKVWRCSIGELRHRLYPVWALPENRSLVSPADSGDDLPSDLLDSVHPADEVETSVLSQVSKYVSPIWGRPIFAEEEAEAPADRTGEDEEAIPAIPKTRKARLVRQMAILKQAHRRHQRKQKSLPQLEASQEELVVPVLSSEEPSASGPVGDSLISTALGQLPMFEREVFVFHYTKTSIDCEATAREFGLPLANTQKLVERVWGRLQKQGCKFKERELMEALSQKP